MCSICKPTSTRPCFPQSCSSWARCELGTAIAGLGRGGEFVSGASTVPHSTPLSFIFPSVHFSFKKGDTICSWPKGPKMHHRFPLTWWCSDASLSCRCKASRTDQWTTRTNWATPSIPVNIMMEFEKDAKSPGTRLTDMGSHWILLRKHIPSSYEPSRHRTGNKALSLFSPSVIHVMFKYREQTFLSEQGSHHLRDTSDSFIFYFLQSIAIEFFKVSYKKKP